MLHVDKAAAVGVEGIMLQDILPKRDKMWWSYSKLRTLNFLLLCAIVTDITNGYDGSMLNGIQSVPEWQKFFDHPKGSRLGTISNGVRYGQLAALPVCAAIIQRYGRKWPIAFGSAILLVGVVLQTAAQNYAMFVLGRIFIGFGNTIQTTACPILISELAYPSQRAQMVGIMNTTGSLGSLMAAWITYGTAFIAGSWAWRLPSALQAMSSVFQLSLCFFVPESPRWLVYNNRRDDALAILTKYHAEGDENSEFLKFEMAEIDSDLEMEKAQSLSGWKEWIRTSANRYRLFIVVTVGFIIQWTGNALISYYLHLVLDSIGITNSKTQLIINGCITINGVLWGNLFSLLINKMGRRPLFLIGMGGMFVSFVILTILTGINTGQKFANPGMGHATIAMILLFGAFYKMPAPVVPTYTAEVSPYDLRAKAFVITGLGDALANLFSGYTNPIALAAIGWKYYIVWCCVLISNFLIIYFFYPETKNLSLEEVGQMFDGSDVKNKLIDEELADSKDKGKVDVVEQSAHIE
ncbi:general substrate transporter [Hyaloscypha variabilis F]|uniref:General substrate transporter n=1 Tax=Hyaloscypha variabilis (strain UAMH 11265 / GT02V1 / F) TaxID=1149755 RepID=A0A2J6RET4_HYAVF|nr:general substrate transporter [Hyaloscypha variabilis F]